MFSITEENIASAGGCLLPHGSTFDTQRCEVIKCLKSKDVQACPGSGKTTALLAKLLIISRQLPLKSNKGICVLTHTNVAIDTITQNMGISAGKLFSYPNHFGTIQSFIDKYLAIPAYVERFGRRPDIIDNDWYNSKVDKQFFYLNNKAKRFCIIKGRGTPKEYLHKICFRDLEVSNDKKCKALALNVNVEDDMVIYKGLVRLKKEILQYGILSYDDAYYLASAYLTAHPSLQNLFSKRFAYVFIDEMQDTSSMQLAILIRLFDKSVVVQKIGDINQSIFNFISLEEDCAWTIPEGDNLLEITGSKRFSPAIAKIIAPICVKPQPLTGNPMIPDIAPTIIAFSDNNIKEKVIQRFGELIFEKQLHLLSKPCFKAVGWVGKEHTSKHTIQSYWPSFQKERHTKRIDYASLARYIEPECDEFIRQHSVDHYKKSIVLALLKCLRIADRPTGTPLHSERAFINYISKANETFYHDLRRKLTKWCLMIHKHQNALDEIIDYVKSDFGTFFGMTNSPELYNFLHNAPAEPAIHCQQQKSNTYTHTYDGGQIDIEICTIHRVKGETHTATLYLETYYYKYDIKRIIEYLKGHHISPDKKLIRQNLRLAYVGMSRPSHLLCVAVHKDHLTGHEGDLKSVGWTIDTHLA